MRIAAWATVACAAALGWSPPAWGARAPSCGNVSLKGGLVQMRGTLDAAGMERCVAPAAAAIKRHPRVRGVTVAALATDDDLVNGKALVAAKAIKEKLVTAGLDASMVAAVTFRVKDAPKTTYELRYQELAAVPVAAVLNVFGDVRGGPDKAHLRQLSSGAVLVPQEMVVVPAPGAATLVLPDGREIRLSPGTSLTLNKPEMDDKAPLTLVLDSGMLRARGGNGTQEITAGGATVRITQGTVRVAVREKGGVQVECLDGPGATLVFGDKTLEVPAGQGSRASGKGALDALHPLLAAPLPNGPRMGAVAPGAPLLWQPVEGATTYRVTLATDADMVGGLTVLRAKTPTASVPDKQAPGKWFWRVTAVDADGFTGQPSHMYAFDLPSS